MTEPSFAAAQLELGGWWLFLSFLVMTVGMALSVFGDGLLRRAISFCAVMVGSALAALSATTDLRFVGIFTAVFGVPASAANVLVVHTARAARERAKSRLSKYDGSRQGGGG